MIKPKENKTPRSADFGTDQVALKVMIMRFILISKLSKKLTFKL